MNRQDFRCFHHLRVRWAEVDMQKIVFNAHYLMYFDTAVADYWRALGLPYEQSMHQFEGDIYVKKATIEYHASARIDDGLDVAVKCARVGTSSMQFLCAIFRGDELLVTGELIYVFANSATQTAQPVPAALRDLLTAYEAGQPMVELRVGTWAEFGEAAARVRTEVFVQEQGIAPDAEWDDADKTALHAVAFNRLGQPLAAGRLLRGVPQDTAALPHGVGQISQIGRMAVHRALRGAGYGRSVLLALSAAARARGDRSIMLHAQCGAEGFYRRLGFTPRGEPFDEVGIAHIAMMKVLD